MKNRGWKWSMVLGSKWYFVSIYKKFCRRFKKGPGLLLQDPIPLTKDIKDSDNLWLTKAALEEKARQVVSKISPLKALGLDNMHWIFYERCWPIIGKNTFHMIQACLQYGHILKHLKIIYLSLIRQKGSRVKVNDCRPISLFNVSNKFISKLLANRVLRCFANSSPPPPFKVHFLNRDIYDNILIADHSHLVSRKRSKRLCMGIKFDMENAYDKLDRNFIGKYFTELGFCDRWIN